MRKEAYYDKINLVLKKICRRVGMADEADSKSVVGNYVRVQVPPPALYYGITIDFTLIGKIDGYFFSSRCPYNHVADSNLFFNESVSYESEGIYEDYNEKI